MLITPQPWHLGNRVISEIADDHTELLFQVSKLKKSQKIIEHQEIIRYLKMRFYAALCFILFKSTVVISLSQVNQFISKDGMLIFLTGI